MYVCVYIICKHLCVYVHMQTTEKFFKILSCFYQPDTYILIKKKNEIMPFAATSMGLEIIILSEVNQTEKDKYRMISLICGILKNDTNELIYKTETDPQT